MAGKSKDRKGAEKGVETPDADIHTPVADLHPVVTREGDGYVVVGGRVYAWQPEDRTWSQRRTSEIKQLKLGADNNLYALTENNVLHVLNSSGDLTPDRRPVQLPEGVKDFAVSPMGTIAFVDDHPKAPIGFLEPTIMDPQSTKIVRGNSPLANVDAPDQKNMFRSLAFAQDGSLSVLDSNDNVWRGSRPTSNSNLSWQPVKGVLSEKLAVDNQLDRLVTLRSGAVGAIDQNQNFLERNRGVWDKVQFAAPRAVDTFYERVDNLQEGVGRDWYVPSQLHRESPDENLGKRWKNYATAHQPAQRTEGMYKNAAETLRTQLRNDQSKLSEPEQLPAFEELAKELPWETAETFESHIIDRVTSNANAVLDTLERELGTRNPDGTINAKFRDKRVQASTATVNSDENVLKQLYDVRVAIFGDNDAVAGRLKDLLDQNVFLHIDSKKVMVDAREKSIISPSHMAKNKYAVLTGKLVHDHAVLAEAARAATNLPSVEDIRQRGEWIDGASEEHPNHISTFYRNNYVNLDRVDRFLEGYDKVTASLANRDNRLHRAAIAQDHRLADVAGDTYLNMLNSMSTGEKITLESSDSGKISLLGVSPVVMQCFLPFMQAQGFLEGSAKKGFTLSFTKTDEGVEISIGKATEVAATPFGGRLRAGLFGSVKLLDSKKAVAYAGAQSINKLTVVQNWDNVTTAHVKHDDFGKVDDVVRGLLGEKPLSPYEFLAMSDESRNKRDTKTTTTATSVLEVGVGASIVDNSIDPASRAKFTFTPLAEQVIVGGQLERGESRERGPGQTQTSKRLDQAEAFVSVGHVTDVPGYKMEKVKESLGRSVARDGYAMKVGEDGALESITVQLKPKRLAINTVISKLGTASAKKALASSNVPQLGALVETNPELLVPLEKIRKSDAEMRISLELTPHAMNQVREYMTSEGKDLDDDKVHKYIKELTEKPENLRVIEMVATEQTTYKTAWSAPIPVVGYESKATNTFTRHRANIQVDYSNAGEKPKLKVRGDLLVDLRALPDFSQVNRILRDIDPDRFKFLNNPVGDDPVRHQLAHLTGSAASNRDDAAEKVFVSHSMDREGIGLLNGRLVYVKQSADGPDKIIDAPADISSKIVERLGGPLLAEMSQGETGILRNEMLALTPLDLFWLDQLALDPATPPATPAPVEKDPQRSLNMVEIITDLRAGNLATLDPAQEIILAQFFPAEDCSLNRKELARLLDDRAQFERFKASMNHYVSELSGLPQYVEAELPAYTTEPSQEEIQLDYTALSRKNSAELAPLASIAPTPTEERPATQPHMRRAAGGHPQERGVAGDAAAEITRDPASSPIPQPQRPIQATNSTQMAKQEPARDLKREPGFKRALAIEMKERGLTTTTMPRPGTPEMKVLMDGIKKRLDQDHTKQQDQGQVKRSPSKPIIPPTARVEQSSDHKRGRSR